MIHGHFGELRRPYVSGSLLLPMAPREGRINFLLDTGADQTCLMPADAKAMRLKFEDLLLGKETRARGIGGRVKVHPQTGTITFLELSVGLVIYEVSVLVYPDRSPYRDYPSILGRDVLNDWRIRYSSIEETLTADALRPHVLIPLPISEDRPGK